MKFEIKIIPEGKVDNEKCLTVFFILSIIVIFSYAIWIGMLLDKDWIAGLLSIGMFFVLLFATSYISRIKLRRLNK